LRHYTSEKQDTLHENVGALT